MKVMIVVTHLLGTGHLTRALTLARAFLAAGHQPLVISGGTAVARLAQSDFPVVQLPPVTSNGVDFSVLLDAEGAPVTQTLLDARSAVLLRTLDEFAPDALITELFPFGRRILKAEFITLLEAAKNRAVPPQVFASVRDILAPPSKPAKAEATRALIDAFYTGVLVHSDAGIMPLDLSWPVDTALQRKLSYTGFVAAPPAQAHPERIGEGDIIVSAGGGAVGSALFDCACRAARADDAQTWRILVGGTDAQRLCDEMAATAPANVVIEPARPDFRQMLHHAAASVSLCGYNTALDVLQTDCPAVFVPFDEGGETEQRTRATALAAQEGIACVLSADLTATRLSEVVKTVIAQRRARGPEWQMDGAAKTVRIVAQAVGAPHAD